MNTQAIHSTKHASKVALGGLFSRRTVWSTPRNGEVLPVRREAQAPLTSVRVNWEANIVAKDTEEAVDTYPRVVNTSTFNVLVGNRPTDEIRSLYLAELRGQVTEDDYAELTAKISSGDLLIATTIHSTKAA